MFPRVEMSADQLASVNTGDFIYIHIVAEVALCQMFGSETDSWAR